MNFLCPVCQAKYRIAAEKVEGRASAKMKCRKCGHVIDVHQAMRVASVAPPPPPDVQGAERAPRLAAITPLAPPLGAPGAPAAAPARPPRPLPPPPAPVSEPHPSAPPQVKAASAPAAVEGTPTAPLAPVVESLKPVAIADEWFVGIGDKPVGPLTLDALREKVSSGEAGSDALVWRDGFSDWKPVGEVPELSATLPRALPVPPSIRRPPALRSVDEIAVVSESPESMAVRLGVASARRGPHPLAWIAVIVALALGVTIGVVFFGKQEKQEVIRYVQVPASAAAAPAESVAEVAPLAAPDAAMPQRKVATGKSAAGPAASSGKPLLGLAGLGGPTGIGPVAGGGGSDVAAGSAPGGQLDSSSIQRVVSNFSPSVRRGCWQPALESRTEGAPGSARVVVTATVSPSGAVTDVSTGGDPSGYPGLSRCIASKVQSWRFPSSGSSTTVQVPFVFAAQ